ncbi:MAG: hypothetical protein JSS83_08845 [Cyanobacteria bacterium SZAS LIN-3]|nr:hypothetical protein [Cyanobacteria bacterium SZAS LIN-3]
MKEIVFVDCDRTLVNTDVYPVLCRQLFCDKRKNKFFFQWRHVRTEARPSASEFLQELGKKYDVQVLSLGHSVFQTRVLTELGLIGHVGKIWGPDNVHQIGRPDKFVLIDDMAGESLGIAYKMTWLGRKRSLVNLEDWGKILGHHFIQCRPFTGGTQDEQALTDFLPYIDELLHCQKQKSDSGCRHR